MGAYVINSIKTGKVEPSYRTYTRENDIVHAFTRFLFATIYAYTLMNLPLLDFHDRVNYLIYASDSDFIQTFYSHSWVSYLSNEPIWLAINSYLTNHFRSDDVVRLIIFVSAFTTAWITLSQREHSLYLLVIVLFVPGILQNFIVHLRQGLAISLFVIGYFSRHRTVACVFMASSALIHSAFFLINGMYIITVIINKSSYLTYFQKCCVAISVSAIIPILISFLSGWFEFRQVDEYRYASTSFSGLGFISWFAIFIVLLSGGRAFVIKNLFPVSITALYLAGYFVLPYSARIIECALISIVICGYSLPHNKKNVFVIIIALQSAAFYLLNLNQNWFGWGV